MESTNQDDDSPFESKDDDNGKLLMDSLSKQPTAEPTEAELHRSILSKIAHNIYAKKFKDPRQHQQGSSANVDFRCEDEDPKTIGLSSGVGEPFVERLKSIAGTGIVDIDWPTLQQALKDRLDEVLEQYLERNPDCEDEQYQEPNVGKFNFENSKDEILELIASFNEAPFTIQRICELLYSPLKYYDKTSTFLRGLEKNLRVISSNDWPKSSNDSSSVEVAANNAATPQDIIENNCTSIDNAAHHQQTSAPSSSSSSSSEHPSLKHQQQFQQQQLQQHEDMNQGEDDDDQQQQEPILAQPEPQSEVAAAASSSSSPIAQPPTSETRAESSSAPMSSSPPDQQLEPPQQQSQTLPTMKDEVT